MRQVASLQCALWGDGTLLIRCGNALVERGHGILAVVSSDPVVKAWASERNFRIAEDAAGFAGTIGGEPFDYLFSIGNLSRIPGEAIALASRGAINFHDGPLPRYAGIHATSWALLGRERDYAITWHLMTDRFDAGDILKQRVVEIGEADTAFTLNAKCYEAGAESFVELVREVEEGRLVRMPQVASARSYFGKAKRPPGACLVSWQSTAEDIDALVRALDFGDYANPLGVAKFLVGDGVVLLASVEIVEGRSGEPPGTVFVKEDGSIHVATGSKDVSLAALMTSDGGSLSASEFLKRHAVSSGARLPEAEPEMVDRISRRNGTQCGKEPFWVSRLASLKPLPAPIARERRVTGDGGERREVVLPVPGAMRRGLAGLMPEGAPEDALTAAFAAFLARSNVEPYFDIGFCDAARGDSAGIFAADRPLRIALRLEDGLRSALASTGAELQTIRDNEGFTRDILTRYPDLRRHRGRLNELHPVRVIVGDPVGELAVSGDLVLVVGGSAESLRVGFDAAAIDPEVAEAFLRGFLAFVQDGLKSPDRPLAQLPVLGEADLRRVLIDWNVPGERIETERCLHRLFEDQVHRAPDAIAVVQGLDRWTYRELNARANHLARKLRALGVGVGAFVGVMMEPSLDMTAGLLAVLKSGAAYVPVDPSFPSERRRYILDDAQVDVLFVDEEFAARAVAAEGLAVLAVREALREAPTSEPANLEGGAGPTDLAYVIYTSGSTGDPKGVMVEHRNVAGMFAAMDSSLGRHDTGAWLAVTTTSFDISVLELFWPLTRGLRLVLHAPDQSETAGRIGLSLSFFASAENMAAQDEYRLLIEGAKFADRHALEAVWMPERHFHAFGGLFPNPSVTGAAVAAVTERIRIRAGSVVLPLHDPIRVAEEWSLVDNLSRGRVGISFASGWHADDFVFAPDRYSDRKAEMMRGIERVRALWRGEAISRQSGSGETVDVRILPRPIQPELPVWITAAGNPETFRMAAKAGANVLTHLLGQSLTELEGKIAEYRAAWRESGRPGVGRVTLMLHTFMADDPAVVREKVRAPLIRYLKSSVDLIKSSPWSFPTFTAPATAPAGDARANAALASELAAGGLDDLLEHAFERYFETSGLFGTPESCRRIVERLGRIGVDEIACLVDFGVDADSVLESLEKIAELRRLTEFFEERSGEAATLAAEIRRNDVTHFQCTPSLAKILVSDPEALEALSNLRHFLVGGEALPPALAAVLHGAVPEGLRNMYGPTEATIWSTSQIVRDANGQVAIGRPLGNTEIYLLDSHLEPVPIGSPGEIFIGGSGVARGYLRRPALTAERFVRHPFRNDPEARLYRTGDLGRYRLDGTIEYLGRGDQQVKIRGHRVELGEIEATLGRHPAVREAAVAILEDGLGEPRLVAYGVARPGAVLAPRELETFLTERLPDFMIPSAYVELASLPRTPNGKVDRKALPAPDRSGRRVGEPLVAPRTPTEERLVRIWSEALGQDRIGVSDNFFNLGGHSLSAVAITLRIRDVFQVDLPLQAFLRAPTIEALAGRIERARSEQTESEEVDDLLAEVEGLSEEEVRSLIREYSDDSSVEETESEA